MKRYLLRNFVLFLGFTATDVLAFGSIGHAVGIGIVLGLKNTGVLWNDSDSLP